MACCLWLGKRKEDPVAKTSRENSRRADCIVRAYHSNVGTEERTSPAKGRIQTVRGDK